MNVESWKQHPQRTLILAQPTDENPDPLIPRLLEAEELLQDLLDDPSVLRGEDVRVVLVDGSPW